MKISIQKTWQSIYSQYFHISVDLSGVVIPVNYDPDKHFCVIVAKGITINEAVKGLKKLFKVFLYAKDLDANVVDNNRVADKDYAILFNKNIEADEEFKNLSANQLKEKDINGITLLERLLLEILHFDATRKHLDVKNATLCSGSRDSVGHVPLVDWYSDDSKLDVYWYQPGSFNYFLRARVVVSL